MKTVKDFSRFQLNCSFCHSNPLFHLCRQKTTAFSLPLLLCCEIAVKLYPRVSCIVAGEEMFFFLSMHESE